MVKSCFLVILLLLSTKSHTEDRCSDMADLRLLNCLAEHKFNYIIGGELVTLDRHLESVELAPNDPNFDLFRQFLNTQIKEVKLLMLNTFEDRAVSLQLDVIDGDLYHHGNLVDLGAFYNGGVATCGDGGCKVSEDFKAFEPRCQDSRHFEALDCELASWETTKPVS